LWAVARVPNPPPERTVQRTILVQTLVLFAVLSAALWVLLRRITRPLASLTTRTEAFAATRRAGTPLAEEGPDDVRHLIAAYNAMEGRIAAMLDEKDVMLGAIGHDLKTPLAALRVRIEAMPDETQRARMAATIEDMAAMLDDILMLARVGRPGEPREPTDLGALAASVVSEFEDLGEPATLLDGARVVAPVQASWLRRALRNLVGNAVRYGGAARVAVLAERGEAVVRVDDDGPGIAEASIPAMLEPFARGEGSRNRQTGGSGLGLAIARAIAEQHGGRLVLTNRAEGGLRAEIRLPPA
jgi:signal transduction histidine kinase